MLLALVSVFAKFCRASALLQRVLAMPARSLSPLEAMRPDKFVAIALAIPYLCSHRILSGLEL